jgi:hypothetical protein
MATPIDNWNYDQLASYINQIRNAGDDLYTRENLLRQVPGLTFSGNYYSNGDPIVQMHNLESDLAEEGYKGRGSGWKLTRGADGSIERIPYAYGQTRPNPWMLATLFAPLAAYAAGVGAAGTGAAAGSAGGAAAGTAGAGAGAGATLGSGVSLGAGGATGITGAVGSGGLTAGAGTGLGFTATGASTGALGSLGSGFFGAETLAGLGAAGGAGLASGAGSAAGSGAGGGAASGAGGIGGSAGGTGGGSMWDTAIDKGIDFATSKAGSTLIGGLLGGAGSNGPDNMTSTTQQQIDPRMAAILYGSNGNNGFLSRVLSESTKPQNTGMAGFGSDMDKYLQTWGSQNFYESQNAARGLQDSNIAAPQMQAAQINAPGQNNLNLAPAYQDMVYGAPGSNPFLTGAIQRGINQSTNAFQDQLSDVTRNLTQNILPSIRSGAMINGAMGSSRQGIAEGRALEDYSTQMGRALQRFGQGNTDAAVAAQAGAYDTDRNRALSAMSGLGAQQYGVATNQAQLNQQANQANLQSQLSTNQLNSANKIAGIGASRGLLGDAYQYGANQDAYGMSRLGQTSNLLSPYTGLGTSSTQTSPLYENKVGGALSGAMAGLGLWNAMKGSGSLNNSGFNNWLGGNSASTGLGWSDLANSF